MKKIALVFAVVSGILTFLAAAVLCLFGIFVNDNIVLRIICLTLWTVMVATSGFVGGAIRVIDTE